MRLREHPAILEGRNDILLANPEELSIDDGYNVRDLTTPEALRELDELEELVHEHGVQTPLKVRFDGERIIVVEGHRRLTVVKRLRAKYVESNGLAGRLIQSVPIFAEPKGTTPLDRDFGLVTSNSGEKLKPLELANLIYRVINQRGLSEEQAAKGFRLSIEVLRNHLKMRAMPDDVKAQVNNGTVSATLAARITKKQPELAAKLIRENAEENARLNGKRRVTPATIKRNAPAKPKLVQGGYTAPEGDGTKHPLPTTGSGVTPAPARPIETATSQTLAAAEQLREVATNGVELPSDPNPIPQRDGNGHGKLPQTVKQLVEALEPFACLAHDHDFNAHGDDDVCEVPFRHLKKAWTVFAAVTGGTEHV